MRCGHEKQKEKIKQPDEKPPEKPPGFHDLPGNKAAGEAGEDIDGADGRVDLRLLQMKTVKSEGEGHQKNGGDKIGDDQGAYDAPDSG